VGHVPAPHLVGAILQPVRPGRALHRPTGPGAWAAPGHGRPAPARRWPATPTPGQAWSRGGRACGGSGRSRPTARPAPGSPRPPRPAGRGPRRRRSASIPAARRACQRLTRRRVGHRRHRQARRADNGDANRDAAGPAEPGRVGRREHAEGDGRARGASTPRQHAPGQSGGPGGLEGGGSWSTSSTAVRVQAVGLLGAGRPVGEVARSVTGSASGGPAAPGPSSPGRPPLRYRNWRSPASPAARASWRPVTCRTTSTATIPRRTSTARMAVLSTKVLRRACAVGS
jgi:hypothetical protein